MASGTATNRTNIELPTQVSGEVLQKAQEQSAIMTFTWGGKWSMIKQKIEDGKGYPVHVKILTVVADYVRTSSRMDFAKELFNIPLPDRYDWLEKRVYQKLQEDNRTTQEINQMINFTRQLSGAFEDD